MRGQFLKHFEATEPIDLADAITARVRSHPDRPALVTRSEIWTYAQLDEYARRVEHLLRSDGIGVGDVVAVQGRKSPQVVATLLGVLLADAAYLALGEQPPTVRHHRMLDEASVRTVFAEDPEPFRGGEHKVTTYEEVRHQEPVRERQAVLAAHGDPPGYIVYTSGTTGVPKGVVIARHSLTRHAETVRVLLGLSPEDRVLQAATLAFDVAAEEIWPTLASGASIDILPGGLGEVSFERLTQIIDEQGITVCNLPASYFSGWAAHLDETRTTLPGLRLVVTGSEALPVETARNWCATAGRPRLIYAYGVSEATITSVACELRPELITGERVPIGSPLSGVRTVVVDEQDAPVPPGAEGQLLIAGAGVALGYCGADPLPRERFHLGPVDGAGEGPWYRTGDRVREERGLLYFLGRFDDQIKAGGVRIDPGEIAAALTAHHLVTDAKVFKVGERLVGCVCAPHPTDRESMIDRLRTVLPQAMIPAEILSWERFPVTAGGKIDMRALRTAAAAQLEGRLASLDAATVRPVLRRLWQEVLGAPEVGADSDFFTLGGDSLSAARLSSALLQEIGVAVSLRTVFSHPRFDDYLQQVESTSTPRQA